MTSLSSIKYGNTNANYQASQISASTRRKLESLGIDPTLVTSESQALSLIATRESEKAFDLYATQQEQPVEEQPSNSSESSLISEAKSLAEQLGLTVSQEDTFEDITAAISNAIRDMIGEAAYNPQVLQQVQNYQAQLSNLTTQYNDVTTANSSMYYAMDMQAANARYMLGL